MDAIESHEHLCKWQKKPSIKRMRS